MALKIWLNGSMKKIDTNLHKPVIFLNGTKYKLDKAYTFVNGVKQQIWGESGIQIDYISSTGTLAGGIPFVAGDNWLGCYNGKNVFRIDISNLSNPVMDLNVAWGMIKNFNGFLSSSGNMIFSSSYMTAGGGNITGTVNKIQINTSTGDFVVIDNNTHTSGLTYIMQTENGIFHSDNRTKTFSTSHSTTSRTYGTTFYFNNSVIYQTGREPASISDTSGNLYLADSSRVLQVGQDSVLFNMTGSYSTGAGTYIGTTSSYNKLGNVVARPKLYDGDYIISTTSSGFPSSYVNPTDTTLHAVDKISYATLLSYDVDYANTGNVIKFLGKIGNYYYVLVYPYSNIATSGVKLVVLNKADFSVAYTKDLEADPFNENNGYITFWYNCNVIPQESQTNYLVAGTFNSSTLGLRVVRFSAIF